MPAMAAAMMAKTQTITEEAKEAVPVGVEGALEAELVGHTIPLDC